MKKPETAHSSYSMHRPVSAGFHVVDKDEWGSEWGYLMIEGEGSHQATFSLVHHNAYDLLFLHQLRYAVEKAIRWYVEMESS